MWDRKESNFRAYDLQSLPVALTSVPVAESCGPDPHSQMRTISLANCPEHLFS